MRNKILPIAFLFFARVLIFSELEAQPVIQWQKCLGGSEFDAATCIRQTIDGGYIVVGYTYSNNGDVSGNHNITGNISDYWIVKLNSSAVIQWQKCLGGTGNDEATSVRQTYDGGYIVAGYSASIDGDVSGNHGNWDYWIIKLDSSGVIEWQKCLGGSSGDQPTSIQQTSDSGYIVAGQSNSNDGDVSGNHGGGYSDYWVVKVTNNGTIQWQKSLGGTATDEATSIVQTRDGGYMVAGSTSSIDGDVTGYHGGWNDCWLVKLNANGIIQWEKCLGGSDYDYASSIQQTFDGGYVIACTTVSNDSDVSGNHGRYDYWIVKTDSVAAIQWQNCLGGSKDDFDPCIQQTTDGGFIVLGSTTSYDGDVSGYHDDTTQFLGDYWIVKLLSNGDIQWQKCLGGTDFEEAFSVEQTTDGGYILAGRTVSNDGDVSGNHAFGDDCWIVKLSAYTGTNEVYEMQNAFYIYPNPLISSSILQLDAGLKNAEVIISDMLGKEVMRRNFSSNKVEIERGNLESGVYIVNVIVDGQSVNRKLVVE